jgi:peptidoglycan/LPS O-acetylase OafA/YrhL
VALFFLYGMSGKYLEDFAVGMLISVFYVLSQNASEKSRVSAVIGRWSMWLWGVGILILFFVSIWSFFPAFLFLFPLLGAHNWLSEFPLLLYWMAHVLPLVQGWRHSIVYALYWICVALVIIPFSYVFYRLIEYPWMKLADRTRKEGSSRRDQVVLPVSNVPSRDGYGK